MGRYRYSSSTSELDKQISEDLFSAERSLKSALQKVASAMADKTSESPLDRGRAKKVERDLARALGVLSEVRKIRPSYLVEEVPVPRRSLPSKKR